MRTVSRDYYRELADFTVARKLCTPVEFAVNNESESVAHDVRISMKVAGERVVLLNEHSGELAGSQEGQAFDPRFQLRGSTPGSAIFHSEDLSEPVSLQRAEFLGDPAYPEGSSVALWHVRYASNSPALSIT